MTIRENKSVLTIPHSLEAEQAVLGAIIFENKILDDIINIIEPVSFHEESHRHIFRSFLELYEEKKPIDEIVLGEKLSEHGKLEEIGGYAYLAELVDCVPSSGNIVYYAKILQEHALLRELISIGGDISRKARDPQQSLSELLSESEEKISNIATRNNDGTTVKSHQVILKSIEKYEERKESKKDIIGMPTGFFDLDRIICGLIAPDMITVAADSGMGKSAFAFNIVEYIYTKTDEKRATFIVSREMSNEQIGDRMICSKAKIDTMQFKKGKVDQDKSDKLYRAADQLASANILYNDYLHTFDQIANEARYLHKHAEGGLCFMVIDYLQLLEGVSKSNREQEISYISRNTKKLAKQLNIPIMPLSQLNRDLRKRSNKRPIRSDLRESAAIEHDSDILLFLYRDDFYNEESEKKNIAEVIIDKHRNGPTGMVELRFDGRFTKFENLYRER